MSMEQKRGLIECQGICKTFKVPSGEHQVVADFDLTADENEFICLFGPGQCGKTTLINLIIGHDHGGRPTGYRAGAGSGRGVSEHHPVSLADCN